MAYLDTNVIIAYGFDGDPNHEKAVSIIEGGRSVGEFYGSTFTLVELFCALYRNIQKYRLPPGIEQIVDERSKVRVTVSYLLYNLNIHMFSDESRLMDLDNLKSFHVFYEAIHLAQKIKLRTLDMLHLAYANQLAKKNIIDYFITLDSAIVEKKGEIEESIGVKVVSE